MLRAKGYDPDSVTLQTVTIKADGTPEPAVIVYTFKRLAEQDTAEIPLGELIQRVAVAGNPNNNRNVNIRATANEKGKQVASVAKGTQVWAVRQVIGTDGKTPWTEVLYNGKQGYIRSDLVQVLSQAETDDYQDTLPTPVPVITPEPAPVTPTPDVTVVVITPEPTAVPVTGHAATTTATHLRQSQSDTAAIVGGILPMGEYVHVNSNDGTWANVSLLDGRQGFLRTETLRPASEEEAEIARQEYAASHATPTPEPAANTYTGYAVTAAATELRSGTGSGEYVTGTLNANELVNVLYNDGTWSLVQALDGRQGYVRWDVLTPVNNEVAQQFINEYNARTATPTPVPAVITPLPQMPAEQTGYARVAVEYAPYRQMPGEYSNIINWLPQNEVVYVVGQVYDTSDPNPWHIAMYGQDVGYIRYDHLRMMSEAEVFEYLADVLVTPEPVPQNPTYPEYNPGGLSSYGYVTQNKVNLRDGASTSGTRVIKQVDQYDLGLVMGTTSDGSSTWYRVSIGGAEGYIHGNYFKQMTVQELSEFLNSSRYNKDKNTGSGGSGQTYVNNADPLTNPETVWVTPAANYESTYAEWQPLPGPETLPENREEQGEAGVQTGSVEGSVEETPASSGRQVLVTCRDTDGKILSGYPKTETIYGDRISAPEIEGYELAENEHREKAPDQDENGNYSVTFRYSKKGSVPWLLIIILLVLLLAGGGVGGWFYLNSKNKRSAAKRAAERKAKASRAAAAARATPTASAYPGTTTARTPTAAPSTGTANPYKRPAGDSFPYEAAFKPAESAPAGEDTFAEVKAAAETVMPASGTPETGSAPDDAPKPADPAAYRRN